MINEVHAVLNDPDWKWWMRNNYIQHGIISPLVWLDYMCLPSSIMVVLTPYSTMDVVWVNGNGCNDEKRKELFREKDDIERIEQDIHYVYFTFRRRWLLLHVLTGSVTSVRARLVIRLRISTRWGRGVVSWGRHISFTSLRYCINRSHPLYVTISSINNDNHSQLQQKRMTSHHLIIDHKKVCKMLRPG